MKLNVLLQDPICVITFIMLLTTVDVFLRYFFNSPLPGAYTLCEIR